MINQDIISECRGIIQETDPNNSHVTDALLLTWIDACTLQLFSILNTLPKSNIPGIVAANTITLPNTVLKLDYVSILDQSGNHITLTTTDFNTFVRTNPGWEDNQPSTPSLMIRMDDLNWMLWPKPNTEFVGQPMSIYGTINPITPATTFSSPQISVTMHVAYPHYLAWKAFLVVNDPQRAMTEYRMYDDLRKQNTKTATSTTGAVQRFTMQP